MRILFEDLKQGDLEDLVYPWVEIDSFRPKIDDKNIVLTFFVKEENPAYDLKRFIEFSSKSVLDAEVSPAPDRNGDYLVFVEFTPIEFAKKVYKVLKSVGYLTKNSDWIYKAYGKRGKLKVT